MMRPKQLDKRIDYSVILPVFLLALIGLASLYVAYSHDGMTSSPIQEVLKQGTWFVLGIFVAILVMQLNAKWIWKLTPWAYLAGCVLMIILAIFYDRAAYAQWGSKNWLRFGGFSLQPSELMKIAYILAMARLITQHNLVHLQRTIRSDWQLIFKMVLLTIPIGIFQLIQDDFGTMLTYTAIFGGLFLMSGISWRITLPIIGIGAFLGATAIFLVTTPSGRDILYTIGFKPYQFLRIESWLDPFSDPNGASFQQARSLMAVGSGGIFGKGFNVSDVYVPVRESDFIFTVIAENFGFVGSSFVIFLYFLLIYRIMHVCLDSNNQFYTYIASGWIMMLLFQVFENIGASIGLLPLTGLTLPFVSQGGSSLLANMIALGIVLSMRYQHDYDTLN